MMAVVMTGLYGAYIPDVFRNGLGRSTSHVEVAGQISSCLRCPYRTASS